MERPRFSIWIEPEGEIRERLSKIIESLAYHYGTPVFDPHVTLLGGIEMYKRDVLDRLQQLVGRLTPYTITLTGTIECAANNWAQSMIVLVEKTEQVMTAHDVAREAFSLTGAPYTKPHLSLMYTESIPQPDRRQIAAELDKNQLMGSFQAQYLNLILATQSGFKGIRTWEKVVQLPLTD